MPDEQEQGVTCNVCNQTVHIGDWPMCPHGSTRCSHAQGFDPIVVHVSADGTYSFPGAVDAPVKAGYRKVEIRTIQEADRVTKEVNAKEDSILRSVHAQSDQSRFATRARNREFIDSIKNKLSPAARQRIDQAREYLAQKDARRENTRPRATNFHMDVFSQDSSNREVHRDERTGWKGRKG
jgi:hypothetical protein